MNSTLNSTLGEISKFTEPLKIFAAVTSIIILILGLFGNLLTIIALMRYPKVRNVTAAFIISLCVADFIFCLLVLPFDSIRFINSSWTEIRFLCILVPFFRYGNTGVSLLFVAAITINRYIMITHHSIYGKVYKKHWIALMIFFCYICSYGMQIPTLLGAWGQFSFDKKLETCSIIADSRGNTSKIFLFVMGFVIPCLVIICCYTKIFYVVHGSEARLRQHSAAKPTTNTSQMPGRDTREIKRRRSEWRITKMVLVIFLGFVACYLPITIVKVFDQDVYYPGLHIVGYLLLYFASCVNPIIYVIMNKQYRQAYANVINCEKIRTTMSPYGSSARGPTDLGQDYSKDYSKTMVSTVSMAMNPVIRKSELSDDY